MESTAEVSSIIAEVTGLAPDFNPNSDLYLELGVPSMKAIQLLIELEDRLGVSIPDEEFVKATSAAALQAMVDRLRQ